MNGKNRNINMNTLLVSSRFFFLIIISTVLLLSSTNNNGIIVAISSNSNSNQTDMDDNTIDLSKIQFKDLPEYEQGVNQHIADEDITTEIRIMKIEEALLRMPEQDRIEMGFYDFEKDQSKEENQEEYLNFLLQIWNKRQEMILKAYEEVISIPQVIIDMKQSINITDILLLNNAKNDNEKNNNEFSLLTDERKYDLIDAIENIEYELGDIDMAKDFHTMGGWSMLMEIFGNTEMPYEITSATAWAIGSAVKGTKEYQMWLLEPLPMTVKGDHTVLKRLIDCLQIPETRRKAIYALSAGTSGNPILQYHFWKYNGLSYLQDIFIDEREGIATKVKAVTLLSDMIMEVYYQGELSSTTSSEGKEEEEDIILMKELENYRAGLFSKTMCNNLIEFFDYSIEKKQLLNLNMIEKSMIALQAMIPKCVIHFNNNNNNNTQNGKGNNGKNTGTQLQHEKIADIIARLKITIDQDTTADKEYLIEIKDILSSVHKNYNNMLKLSGNINSLGEEM